MACGCIKASLVHTIYGMHAALACIRHMALHLACTLGLDYWQSLGLPVVAMALFSASGFGRHEASA